MHMIKRIWNFITTAVLVIMLMLVAILYIPKFLGISPKFLGGDNSEVYPIFKVTRGQQLADENPKKPWMF